MQKLLTFFSKNISVYAILNDQSFNDTLTNDIVSFEQVGPDDFLLLFSSPEQKLRVSYCHHPMSVVRRHPSFVVNN